jgi:hypothetical protein
MTDIVQFVANQICGLDQLPDQLLFVFVDEVQRENFSRPDEIAGD